MYVPKYYVMKMCGGGNVKLHVFVILALGSVNGQIHTLAALIPRERECCI